MTSNDPADRHRSVLLEQCVQLLAPALEQPGSLVIDATCGMGGHALALLQACPTARLVGIDRDPAALGMARTRLADYAERVELVHAVYDQIPKVLARLGIPAVDAVLFDLGVSSLQLDESERGFAYAQDAPLDMRMNPGDDLTAAQLLNEADEAELIRILREFGEERYAPRIARGIVARREQRAWQRSGELVELIRGAIPAAAQRQGGHPAKRTFQALRIAVNGELEVLARAIPAALDALAPGGRIAVLSYHSLEDRIVKQALASRAHDTTPAGLPVSLPQQQASLRLLTRGAASPSRQEITANPRAASARLRAAQRLSLPAQERAA